MFRSLILILLSTLSVRSASAIGCSALVTPVAFGVYSPVSALPADSLGTVTVTCTTLIALLGSFTVQMSTGNASGFSPRQMTSGTDTLNYNLYTDLGHTRIWGDGTGGTSIQSYTALLTIGATVVPYIIYGRIGPSQNVRGGTYSDSVVITITF